MAAHNDLIARVMHRNNIAQVDLAYECQLSESTISRIIHSQRVVTPEVIRALYKLTEDPEMIAFIFGTPNFALIKHTGSDLSKSQAECLAVIACSKVMSKTGTPSPSRDDRFNRIAMIDKAMTSLAALRSKIIPNTTTQSTTQRFVKHQAIGQVLDASA